MWVTFWTLYSIWVWFPSTDTGLSSRGGVGVGLQRGLKCLCNDWRVYSLEVYHLPGSWPLNCKLLHRFSLDLHTNNEGLESLGCNKSPLVGRPIQNHGCVTIIRVSTRLIFPASQGGLSVTQERMCRLLLCLSPILMILLLWKYV